jgi:hypothetical protein
VRRYSVVEEAGQRLGKTLVRSYGLGRKKDRLGTGQISQKIMGAVLQRGSHKDQQALAPVLDKRR